MLEHVYLYKLPGHETIREYLQQEPRNLGKKEAALIVLAANPALKSVYQDLLQKQDLSLSDVVSAIKANKIGQPEAGEISDYINDSEKPSKLATAVAMIESLNANRQFNGILDRIRAQPTIGSLLQILKSSRDYRLTPVLALFGEKPLELSDKSEHSANVND